jgi:hypothetical protein
LYFLRNDPKKSEYKEPSLAKIGVIDPNFVEGGYNGKKNHIAGNAGSVCSDNLSIIGNRGMVGGQFCAQHAISYQR